MALSTTAARAGVVAVVGVVTALLPVLFLPLVVGGVHPEAAAAFAVVELVALSLWWGARLARGHRLRVSFLALPFVVGAGLTLLQVIPLPQALLDVLQPETASTRRFIAAGLPDTFAAGVRAVTSMDPAASAAALLRLVGAAALFVVVADAARDGGRDGGRGRSAQRSLHALIWRGVVVAAAVVMLTAIMHTVLNVPGPWGQFSRLGGIIFAPMVNPNHLSKVLAGFALLCLGRAFSVRGRREAVVSGIVGVVCGVGVGLTLSRGGILALILALMALAAVLLRAKRIDGVDGGAGAGTGEAPSRFALPALFVSAILVVVIGLVVLAVDPVARTNSTQLIDDAEDQPTKLAILPQAMKLLADNGRVGVGNNAFGAAFTTVAEPGARYTDELTFSHPENIVVATVVEHGVGGGALLLIIAAFVARHLVFALRSARAAAAVPAVVAFVIGDMVDFALETGAGIAVFAVALGLCAAAVPSTSLTLRAPRAVVAAVVAILVSAVVVVAVAPGAIADWQYRLDTAAAKAPLAQRTQALYALVRARPFDGHATTLLAVDARERHQPQEALAWANRTLSLWPSRGEAHLEAARALAATGHLEQAMIHYHLAAGSQRVGGKALAEAFSRSADVAVRERALPDTAEARMALCVVLLKERRFDDAAACADVLAARADASDEHKRLALRVALDGGDDDALRARIAAASRPPDGEDAALLARAIARLDGDDAALSTSAPWLDGARSPKALLEYRLRLQEQKGDLVAARETLAALRPVSVSPAERDQVDRHEVVLHRRAGDFGAEVVVLQRLVAKHPREPGLLSQLGIAEHAAGRTGAALGTYRRLRELAPDHAATAALQRALGLEKPSELR